MAPLQETFFKNIVAKGKHVFNSIKQLNSHLCRLFTFCARLLQICCMWERVKQPKVASPYRATLSRSVTAKTVASNPRWAYEYFKVISLAPKGLTLLLMKEINGFCKQCRFRWFCSWRAVSPEICIVCHLTSNSTKFHDGRWMEWSNIQHGRVDFVKFGN